MRTPRIFTDQALAADDCLTLEPGPSAHVSRVLRMGPGQALKLFNGAGGEYLATITAADKRSVTVRLGECLQRDLESPLGVELGIGISRGDRMDWVLQKATELGVQRVAPLLTERTEVKLRGERAGRKQQHWRQVIISACEQCGRNHLPDLAEPASLADWLANCEAERKFVLHHRAQAAPAGAPPRRVALVVGPEGGLSGAEIDACLEAGFDALSLGPRVLRTETAPLAALAILQARWGDMRPELPEDGE